MSITDPREFDATVAAPDTTPRAARPIPKIPGFEILDVLGSGGMGVVYKALQIRVKHLVALKMLMAVDRPGAPVDRFRSEVEAVAKLQHPNIVQIHDVGEANGLPYFSMEYVSGGSLAQRLGTHNPQPPVQAARLVRILAETIHYAHQNKIVHRDLKPGNVLLAPVRAESRSDPPPERIAQNGSAASGQTGPLKVLDLNLWAPKVSDFGLAKNLERDNGQTRTQDILGTPSYMAPEQAASGKHVGPTADVYSLGAILYWALTGRPPFRGLTPFETLDDVRSKPPQPPRSLQRRISKDLDTVCLKCLEKDPAKRYPSAQELAEDLGRYLAGDPVKAQRVGPIGKLTRWCGRNPALASSILAAAFFLITGSAFSFFFGLRSRQDARRAEANAARADSATRLSDRRAYANEILLAHDEWRQGDMISVRHRLAQEADADPGHDLRGFEWSYLQRLCRLELRTLRVHAKEVYSVAFSQDDRLTASAGEDGLVQICEVATGRLLQTLRDDNPVCCVAFHPNGQWLAAGGGDHAIKLWDFRTGRVLYSFAEHSGAVRALAFNADGSRLLSGSDDCTAKLWDVAARRLLNCWHYDAGVRWVAFTPDHKQIALLSRDGCIELRDLGSGGAVVNVAAGNAIRWGAALSSDGRYIASANHDQTITLWDLRERGRPLVLPGHAGVVHAVAFEPDGAHLVSASMDHTIRIWETATGKVTATLVGHESDVLAVALSHDGRLIASGGADHTMKIWDRNLAKQALDLRGHGEGWSSVQGTKSVPTQVCFSPDGQWLASGSVDQTVKIWRARTGDEKQTLVGHKAIVSSVAFRGDSAVVASGGTDGHIIVWDLKTGKPRSEWPAHVGAVYGLAYFPDGTRLVSAGADGTVKLWDAEDGHSVATAGELKTIVQGVALSPDGQRLAAARQDGVITFWDLPSSRRVDIPVADAFRVRSVCYSPDGTRLASAGGDGVVRLWDAITGSLQRELPGHTCEVASVQFSADGMRLVTASVCDDTARIWDVASGLEITTLACEPGLCSAVFSPDGLQLVGGANDGTLKLWDARPLDDDLSADREARSLVEFLVERGQNEREMLLDIRANATIAESVRRRALEIAGPYARRLLRCEAGRLVAAHLAEPQFREEARSSIGNDTTISKPLRQEALELLESYDEDVPALRSACFEVLLRPDAKPAKYGRALHQAQILSDRDKSRASCRILLGMAQYRNGQWTAAVDSLTAAEKCAAKQDPFLDAIRLGFLAMAQQRAGLHREAQATRARLLATMNKPMQSGQKPVAKRVRDEAELLISGTLQNAAAAK